MLSKKKKIEPELRQTPWQEEAVAGISKGMQQPYKPFSYTPYPTGETKVGRILESPYYQSLKTGALTEETEGIGRLRRGAQLGGMLYSTPRLGAEAGMIGRTTTGLQRILGGMAEAERTTEKERAYREYEKGEEVARQEHLREQDYPQQIAKLAQILLGQAPWEYPMYEETPTGFGSILSTLGKLAPMIIKAIATGGASAPLEAVG